MFGVKVFVGVYCRCFLSVFLSYLCRDGSVSVFVEHIERRLESLKFIGPKFFRHFWCRRNFEAGGVDQFLKSQTLNLTSNLSI